MGGHPLLDSLVFRAQAVPNDSVPEGTSVRIAVAEIDATNYFVSLDGLEIGSASPRLSASVVSHAETRQKSMLQQSLDFVEMARLQILRHSECCATSAGPPRIIRVRKATAPQRRRVCL